jgi:AraC-like DNA-binding protein
MYHNFIIKKDTNALKKQRNKVCFTGKKHPCCKKQKHAIHTGMMVNQDEPGFPQAVVFNRNTTAHKAGEDIVPDIRYLVFRKCTPAWKIVKDEFTQWDITYITAGSARYTIDDKEYELAAGDLLCLPPGHIRAARTFKDRLMNCFAVNCTLSNLQGKPAKLPFPLISHIGEQEDLIHLFHELTFTWVERQPAYSIKCRALFLLVLHRLFELLIYSVDSSAWDYRIQKVVRHIAKHYPEKLTVGKMAAFLGLNPVYFGTLFKRETGMSMKHYVTRIRIKNAENMLRSGEYKVGEIAERCGYNDTFHFYKQFKLICGFSPSECIPKRNSY